MNNNALTPFKEYETEEKRAAYEEIDNETLVLQIQSGENVQEATETLYLKNMRLMYQIAKKYAQNADTDDLMQEAYFALVKAIKNFKADKGFKFTTYLTVCTERTFQRYIANTKNTKRLPVHIQTQISAYKKHVAEYSQAHGEQPDDSEICAALGMKKQELEKLRKVMYEAECISLETLVPNTDDMTVEETIADPNDMEEQIVEEISRAEIWRIVDELDEEKSSIIRRRYLHSKTLDRIAKENGYSIDTAARIIKLSLGILRENKKLQRVAKQNDYLHERSIAYKGTAMAYKHTGTSITEYIAVDRADKRAAREYQEQTIDNLFDEIIKIATV